MTKSPLKKRWTIKNSNKAILRAITSEAWIQGFRYIHFLTKLPWNSSNSQLSTKKITTGNKC